MANTFVGLDFAVGGKTAEHTNAAGVALREEEVSVWSGHDVLADFPGPVSGLVDFESIRAPAARRPQESVARPWIDWAMGIRWHTAAADRTA